jgi:hypothetical protein
MDLRHVPLYVKGQTRTGDADYYARIGSGGPTINVEGNSGSILLVRYRE